MILSATGAWEIATCLSNSHGMKTCLVVPVKGNDQSVLGGNWVMDGGKLKTDDISDDIDRAFDG